MKISTKGEYGLRALIELARYYGQGYIQSSVIAQARNIPENYLYQLLIALRKAGLIRSRRGPQGGHMLARSPEFISMAEAVIALEGPLAVTPCVQEDVESDCPFEDQCPIREVWQRITDLTHEVLQTTSLLDLLKREDEKRKGNV